MVLRITNSTLAAAVLPAAARSVTPAERRIDPVVDVGCGPLMQLASVFYNWRANQVWHLQSGERIISFIIAGIIYGKNRASGCRHFYKLKEVYYV